MNALSVAQVAERWQCSRDAVYDLINSGQLRAFRVGSKVLRLRLGDIEAWESGGDTKSDNTGLASSRDAPSPSGETQKASIESASTPPPKPRRARRSIDTLAAGRY